MTWADTHGAVRIHKDNSQRVTKNKSMILKQSQPKKKKKSYRYQNFRCIALKKKVCAHNLKRQNKALLKPHVEQFIVKLMERRGGLFVISFP